MAVTVMDISQMPVGERRGGRGRRTSRGQAAANQLSLRQERRRRKEGSAKDEEEEFGDTKEEEKVKEFRKESSDKEWGMDKKGKNRGEVDWRKGVKPDKLSLIKEDPTGPRGGPGILDTQVE